MSPSQRAAAERLLAEHPTLFMNDLPDWCDDAFHLLRELAAEPVQEPMAWHTEDHLTDPSATTYSKDVADRWQSKGWPVTPLYAAPQHRRPPDPTEPKGK